MERPLTDEARFRRTLIRAVRTLVLRDVATRAVALAGGLTLAALLGPADFGVFVVGLGTLTVLQELSSLGLGATLLRRPEPPSRAELRALVGFQLEAGIAVGVLVFAVVFVVLPVFGADSANAEAVALLLLAIPVSAWRTPARCVLERDLRYAPLSLADLSEQLCFYAAAVPLAAAGAGIWCLPVGGIAGAAAASGVSAAVARVAPRPSADLRPLRGIWRFGAKFQATQVLSVVRDLGLNALLLAFAGSFVAGVWALVQRVLAGPMSFFQILWRVGFVAFAKVSDRDEAERHARRVMSMCALAGAALIPIVVAAEPALVGGILGERWAGIDRPLLFAAAGWVLTAPVFAALHGLFQARSDLRAPTRSLLVQIAILWTTAIALAPSLGAEAVGAAWLIALLLNAWTFVRLGRPLARLDLAPVALGAALSLVVAGAGRAVAEWMPNLLGLAVSGLVALAVWLVLGAMFMREDLRRLLAVARPAKRPASSALPVADAPPRAPRAPEPDGRVQYWPH